MDKRSKLVEVARSFSYKLNVGNYESRDFFCSQKAECLESEAEDVSRRLQAFCKREVLASLSEYRAEQAAAVAEPARPAPRKVG